MFWLVVNDCKIAHISAFDGGIKKSPGYYSGDFQTTLPMNGPSCISWCITYLSCVAVIIPRNGGNECLYLSSHNPDRANAISKPDRDQYEILRVCIPRTEGEHPVWTIFTDLVLLFPFEVGYYGQGNQIRKPIFRLLNYRLLWQFVDRFLQISFKLEIGQR